MKLILAFLVALAPLAASAQDEAPVGAGTKPAPKPKPRPAEGAKPTPKPSDTPRPADTPLPSFGEDPNWKDTHRVKLRNGNSIDGIYDEKNSTDELIIIRYSPSTEIAINVIDIARDANGKPIIEKITMRHLGDDRIAVTSKEPERRDPDKTDPIKKDPDKTDPIVDPAKFSQETKAKVDAIIAAFKREKDKLPYVDQLVKAGQDGLLYACTLVPALDEDTATWVFAAFSKAKDNRVNGELRQQLGKLKNPATIVALINLFGFLDDKRALPFIVKLAGHENEAVRYGVVDNVGKLGDRTGLELVANACVDGNKQVRMRAKEVLVELATRTKGQRDAFTFLRAAVKKAKPDSVEAAALAFGELGLQDAIQTLLDMTASSAGAVRVAALQSLGQLKAVTALDRLHSILTTEKEADIRATCCETIDKIGAKSSTLPLIYALRSESDDSTRLKIQTVLRHLTGQNFGATYEEWKAWFDSRPK